MAGRTDFSDAFVAVAVGSRVAVAFVARTLWDVFAVVEVLMFWSVLHGTVGGGACG